MQLLEKGFGSPQEARFSAYNRDPASAIWCWHPRVVGVLLPGGPLGWPQQVNILEGAKNFLETP